MTLFWTPERVIDLTTYVNAGMPYAEIGALLGCGKNAALGKATRLGITEDHPKANPRGREPVTLLRRLDALNMFPPAKGCVFPIGDPGRNGFHFCAADTGDVCASYCAEHDKLCRQNAKTLANIAAWESDPERHAKQQALCRRLGLMPKMKRRAA